MKKTDGFTLVELVVGIFCASLVSGAIITFMLMGLRTNRTVIDSNVEQQNARIIMSMVESLASEGGISRLEVDGSLEDSSSDIGDRDWTLFGTDGSGEVAILYYIAEKGTINTHGSVLMEGVTASMLSMSPSPMGGCLLGIAIQTEDASYETSVYNRSSRIEVTGEVVDENKHFHVVEPDSPDHTVTVLAPAARLALIQILSSQLGSTGTIISNNPANNIPYSLWYCQEKGYEGYPPDWDANTPWCATFISWAVAETIKSGYIPTAPVLFAHVDEFWTGADPDFPSFTGQKLNNLSASIALNNKIRIKPGDMIFFDWERDNFDTPIGTLEHVGIVLFTEGDYIYTIEGNSNNQVALQRYHAANPNIVGYGILDWTAGTT